MNEHFNYADALELTDGNTERLLELVNLFLEDYPYQLEQINKAIEELDAKKLAKATSKLKTSVTCLSMMKVYETLVALETMGLNDDLEDVDIAQKQLHHQLAVLVSELSQCVEEKS